MKIRAYNNKLLGDNNIVALQMLSKIDEILEAQPNIKLEDQPPSAIDTDSLYSLLTTFVYLYEAVASKHAKEDGVLQSNKQLH